MIVSTFDSVVVAVADDPSDKLLQLADVVVLPPQFTMSSAGQAAVAMLDHLPGCTLVATGVVTGGCLLRARDLDWILIRTGVWQTTAVTALAIYTFAALIAPLNEQVAPSGRLLGDSRGSRRDPWLC